MQNGGSGTRWRVLTVTFCDLANRLSCTLRAVRTWLLEQFGPPVGKPLSHLPDLVAVQAVARELGDRIRRPYWRRVPAACL